MKESIARIGENRLKSVLIESKYNIEDKVINVLKSDIMQVARSYLENPKVDINYEKDEENTVFFLKICCTRVQDLGILN